MKAGCILLRRKIQLSISDAVRRYKHDTAASLQGFLLTVPAYYFHACSMIPATIVFIVHYMYVGTNSASSVTPEKYAHISVKS
jgi:hypothetical protein